MTQKHSLLSGAADFVGREQELNALQTALREMLSGRGQLILLSGPAGIGKTRTAQEFAAFAEGQGVRVLRGRCYEEPGAPPYWPWVQLIRDYLEGCDEQRLRSVLNRFAALATLVPELGVHLAEPNQSVSSANDEQARFRLFDAVGRFWLGAARERPLLLLIDDLHWADVPSLKLLEFIAKDVSRGYLLGTYRHDEMTRQHPLSDTLGELARVSGLRRLALGGLHQADAERLVVAITGQTPAPDWAKAAYQQSEGNPLFFIELIRFRAQQYVLPALPNPAQTLALGKLPEGVRSVIGKRLNRLSPSCNRLLGIAAVVGRVFRLEIVCSLLDETAAEGVWAALEEARAAHVLEALPEPDHYQFSHVLIRDVLYDEMLPARRLRLHRRIGEILETLQQHDLEPYLSQLAHHFSQAAPPGAADKAIAYATRAAARADALLAYEEAARFYRLALELLERQAPGESVQKCDLLIDLGEAQGKAGEVYSALATFEQAAACAISSGLTTQLARAALGFEEVNWRPGLPGESPIRLLYAALDALGADDSIVKARILSALTRAYSLNGDEQQADQVNQKAVTLARRLDDPDTLITTLRMTLTARWRPEQLRRRLAVAAEALALAERSGNWQQFIDVLGWRLFDLMEIGDMSAVESGLAVHTRLAKELRQPFYEYVNLTFSTMLALFQGRFDEGEQRAQNALKLGQRMPGHDADGLFGLQMFSLRREQGQLREIVPMIRHFVQTTSQAAIWRPGLALIYSELEFKQEARDEFAKLAADEFAGIARDGLRVACLAYLAEVCAFLADAGRAAVLYRLLLPYNGHNIVVGAAVVCYGAAARYLGMLAATMKRWGDAERHFEDALAMDARTGALPWLAHTRYQYAAMLGQRRQPGDRERAGQLLEASLATAAELGMPMLAERAAVLQRKLGAATGTTTYPDQLTRREVEVLRLVAAGKSNREIAERLFISPNTVANHVRNILAKTRTANRTEASAYASHHWLLKN